TRRSSDLTGFTHPAERSDPARKTGARPSTPHLSAPLRAGGTPLPELTGVERPVAASRSETHGPTLEARSRPPEGGRTGGGWRTLFRCLLQSSFSTVRDV